MSERQYYNAFPADEFAAQPIRLIPKYAVRAPPVPTVDQNASDTQKVETIIW